METYFDNSHVAMTYIWYQLLYRWKPNFLFNSHRAGINEIELHKIAEELKADKQWVDGDALDRLTGNRPHQVRPCLSYVRDVLYTHIQDYLVVF